MKYYPKGGGTPVFISVIIHYKSTNKTTALFKTEHKNIPGLYSKILYTL